MMQNVYIYIGLMALTTYGMRVLPLTLIKKPITNPFIQSLLYYIPYVTLAVMTFPAILEATQSQLSGAIALGVGILVAWKGASLIKVALACCSVVFIVELLII